MNDTIYRQDAIDVTDEIWCVTGDKNVAKVWDKIKDLPSAQPKIIRCKDCKWCEDTDGLMCMNTASWVVATDYDFGCILAERRQDETD